MLGEHPGFLGHKGSDNERLGLTYATRSLSAAKELSLAIKTPAVKRKKLSSNALRHRRPKSESRNHHLPSLLSDDLWNLYPTRI